MKCGYTLDEIRDLYDEITAHPVDDIYERSWYVERHAHWGREGGSLAGGSRRAFEPRELGDE